MKKLYISLSFLFCLLISSMFIFSACGQLYTIYLEENGGTEVENITAGFDAQISLPTDLTREFFIFDGWYGSADFSGSKYQATKMPSANITLYAKWKIRNLSEAEQNQLVFTWDNEENYISSAKQLSVGTHYFIVDKQNSSHELSTIYFGVNSGNFICSKLEVFDENGTLFTDANLFANTWQPAIVIPAQTTGKYVIKITCSSAGEAQIMIGDGRWNA